MTDKDIQQLIDKYLEGETSPAEECRLALALHQREDMPEDWQAISLMLGELTLGEAEYNAIMAQRQQKPSALLIALRFISSVAAIFLVGLFFYLQTDTPTKPVVAQNNNVEKKQSAPQPEYCTEGTPREILLCYLERKQAMPNTYSQLKQMNDENK